MRLWLSVLVCCGACWANQMYGAGGGTYFSSSLDNESEITAIKVCFGNAGLMKSIQLRIGSAWSPMFGVPGGACHESLLWPGEHIISVSGSAKAFIRHLVFNTNMKRQLTFGAENGNKFTATGDQPGKVLTGVFGQKRMLGVTGMGFVFDYPLAQPESNVEQEGNETQATGGGK